MDRIQEILDYQPIYLSLEEIGTKLKLNSEELDSYFNQKNIERNYSKTYDVIDIMKYCIGLLDDRVSQLNSKLNEVLPDNPKKSLNKLKEEKIKAQTKLYNLISEIKSIKLKLATGEFILAETVSQNWGYSFVKLRAKLEAIPSKTALQLSSVSDKYNCENIVLRYATEALSELNEKC